jgi:uncharacterized membrane protein
VPLLLTGLATLAYPALIYLGGRYPAMLVLAPALALLALAHPGSRALLAPRAPLLLGITALACLAAGLRHALPLKLYPVLVNAALLAAFAVSLRSPPTAIERIARLQTPELPPAATIYTRKLTGVWCLFFLGNGGIALWTALRGSDAAWFWYNGVIAYGLIGGMLGGERLLRRRMLRGAA